MQNPPRYNPGYNPGYSQGGYDPGYPQQQYMPVQQLPVAQVTHGAHPIANRADGKFTEIDAFKTTGQRFTNKEYKLAFCPPLTGCLCGCVSLKAGLATLALLDIIIGAAWTFDFFEMWMGSWSRYSQRYGYYNRVGGFSFLMFPIFPMVLYVCTSLAGFYGAIREVGFLITIYMCGVVFGVILFAVYAGESLLWYYFVTWGLLLSMAWWKLVVGTNLLSQMERGRKGELEMMKQRLAEQDQMLRSMNPHQQPLISGQYQHQAGQHQQQSYTQQQPSQYQQQQPMRY